jgi:hypothetical protein
LNRAAEKAVPFAKDIFWEAIGQMTFDDATKILNGGDTAATDYFKAKTSKKLQTAFRPSVEDVMNQVGVNRQYNELIGRYKSMPFAKSVTFDVNQYVTEKATDGLFFVVGPGRKKDQDRSGRAGERPVEGSIRRREKIAFAALALCLSSECPSKR